MKENEKSDKRHKFQIITFLLVVTIILLLLFDEDSVWANFFRHLIKNVVRTIFR